MSAPCVQSPGLTYPQAQLHHMDAAQTDSAPLDGLSAAAEFCLSWSVGSSEGEQLERCEVGTEGEQLERCEVCTLHSDSLRGEGKPSLSRVLACKMGERGVPAPLSPRALVACGPPSRTMRALSVR